MQKVVVTEQALEVALLLGLLAKLFLFHLFTKYTTGVETSTGKSIADPLLSTNKSLQISKSLKVESIGYDLEGLGRCSAKV